MSKNDYHDCLMHRTLEYGEKIMSKNDYRDYLMHYNHNHDRLGRFASSGVGRAFNSIESAHSRSMAKQYERQANRYDKRAERKRKDARGSKWWSEHAGNSAYDKMAGLSQKSWAKTAARDKKKAARASRNAAEARRMADMYKKDSAQHKSLVQRSKNQRISDIQSKRGVSRSQAETIYKRQRNAKIAGAVGAAAGGAALVYKAKKGGGVPRLGYGHLGVGTSAKPAKRIASKTVPRIASATTGYRDVVSRAPISNYPAVRRNTGTALRTISNVEPYSIRKELTPKGKAVIGGAAAGAGAVGAYKYKKSRKKK